jgi:hypothetical protein
MMLWEWWSDSTADQDACLEVATGWALHNQSLCTAGPNSTDMLYWWLSDRELELPAQKVPANESKITLTASHRSMGGFLFSFHDSVPSCALTGVNRR